MPPRDSADNPALRIGLTYAAFASAWILLSDKAVQWLFSSPQSMMLAATLKGWVFVAVTSVVLYALVRRQADRERHTLAERRQAEEALRAERELLGEMSAIGHIGGWRFDPRTGAGAWTEEVARIHDLDPSHPSSVEIGLSFFTGESRERIEAAVAASAKGKAYDLELRLTSATGRIKWVRTVGWPQLVDGQVVSVRGYMQDITEQKRLTQELADHREHLEDLVRKRTVQLDEARERAEAASRAKSSFLANMSHEIRTPLNAILGLARLLRRSTLDAQQADRIAKIDDAAHHLLGLISDVLDLSKVEAGRQALEADDFELGALMAQVGNAVAHQAAAKGLDLQVEGVPAPLWLHGDAGRLRQALLNYVANAVKFTPAGWVQLGVQQQPAVDEHAVTLRFEVRDSGIGIAPEHLLRLFNHFEQGDTSTTRRFGGSGLGLAVTRSLVELMGGDVGVDSVPGQGSRFWLSVTLPRGAAPASGRRTSTHVVSEEAVRARHAGMRVLLVEDNPVNREVALEQLQAAGLEVLTAEDGLAAVARVAADAPALVLMDLEMPLMDGLVATRAIRTLPGGATLPILAMTANVTREVRQACAEAGMNDFIGKPFEAENLCAALLRWLPARLDTTPLGSGPVPDPSVPVPDVVLPELIGIDWALAVARAGGRASTSLRILRLFRQSHADDPERISTLIAAAAWPELRRLAHALHGAAGNIGAVQVQQSAAALEQVLRDGSPGIGRDVAARALQSQLHALFVGLDALGEAPVPAPSAPMPALAPAVALDQLAILLAAGDMACYRLLAEQATVLQAALGEAFRPLTALVDNFRYEEAAALLREARHKAAPDPRPPAG